MKNKKIIIALVAVLVIGVTAILSNASFLQGSLKIFNKKFNSNLYKSSMQQNTVVSGVVSPVPSVVVSELSSEVVSDVTSLVPSGVTSLVASWVTSPGGVSEVLSQVTSLVNSEVTSFVASNVTSEVPSVVVSPVTSQVVVPAAMLAGVNINRLPKMTQQILQALATADKASFPGKYNLSEEEKQAIIDMYAGQEN